MPPAISPRIPPPPVSPRPLDCPPPSTTPRIEIEPPPLTPPSFHITPPVDIILPPIEAPNVPHTPEKCQLVPPVLEIGSKVSFFSAYYLLACTSPRARESLREWMEKDKDLCQEIQKKGLQIPESPQDNWRRQKAMQRVATALASSSVKSLALDSPPLSGRTTLRGRRNSFSDLASLLTDFIPPPPLSPVALPPPVEDTAALPQLPPAEQTIFPSEESEIPTSSPEAPPTTNETPKTSGTAPHFARENAMFIQSQSVVSSAIAGQNQHSLPRSTSLTDLSSPVT